MTQTTAASLVPGEGRLPRRQINLVFVGLMVTMLLASLDQMLFATALPTIVGELHGVHQMLWVTTSYVLASTIMMPIYGKLSDVYGRKPLLIIAILIFITGSVVGGFANDMPTLIAGRAIKGLGGGGLMILAQATVADIVPPRDRGRYMGPMGAVFGLSAVLGPLLGGWFTETIGWRWAFWMNIPLGLLALTAVLLFLKLPARTAARTSTDVLGIVTMAISVTALVLFTSWGGRDYAWDSPVIIGLMVATVVSAGLFVLAERRAKDPIIPLALFRERNFNLTTIAGLVTGLALFGVVGYLPTYLQMVHGMDATSAGFMTIPIIGAMLVTSIASGQIASRTGRYKWMPLVGTALITVALYLLSTMVPDTSLWVLGAYMALFGFGLGLGMQILVLIVQNTFSHRVVGTATAGNNFFRQVGSSLGSAVVGSIFASRLTTLLIARLPEVSADTVGDVNSLTPEYVLGLPDAIREPIIGAYNDALAPVFLYLVPLTVVACIILLFVKEVPLRTRNDDGEVPSTGDLVEAGAAAVDTAAVRTVTPDDASLTTVMTTGPTTAAVMDTEADEGTHHAASRS